MKINFLNSFFFFFFFWKNQDFFFFCLVTPALLVRQCYVSSDGHPLSCHGSMLQDNRFRLRQQALKATVR